MWGGGRLFTQPPLPLSITTAAQTSERSLMQPPLLASPFPRLFWTDWLSETWQMGVRAPRPGESGAAVTDSIPFVLPSSHVDMGRLLRYPLYAPRLAPKRLHLYRLTRMTVCLLYSTLRLRFCTILTPFYRKKPASSELTPHCWAVFIISACHGA